MISQEAKYALRAMITLARAGRPMTVGEMALADAAPVRFLEKIMVRLRRSQLVASRRGRGGGHALARPPEEISLGAILRVIDGPLAPLPCLSVTRFQPCEECLDPETCVLRRALSEAAVASRRALEAATLADALSATRPAISALENRPEPVST
jgi:Rrf2 family protein